ncbi:GxxExxY protein [Planctomicrobium sp. SH661]|uniref:GxxExxY protein n=1 Tax=Planctomicrobium sp. SH661 TaxID=3448124 RepID=UPI003F5BD884
MALIYEEESYAILGACFEVYNEMGPGFLESVYQECLALEFASRGIPFVAKTGLLLQYKNVKLTQTYEADFVCFGKIILKIKAVSSLHEVFRAQLLNYLAATDFKLGFLVNFCSHPKLEYQRIAR